MSDGIRTIQNKLEANESKRIFIENNPIQSIQNFGFIKSSETVSWFRNNVTAII